MEIRQATLEDTSLYFDHMRRHFRESGKDGDVIFHPVVEFESWRREEQIAFTIEITIEQAVAGVRLPRDLGNRGRVVALFAENFARRIHDGIAAISHAFRCDAWHDGYRNSCGLRQLTL